MWKAEGKSWADLMDWQVGEEGVFKRLVVRPELLGVFDIQHTQSTMGYNKQLFF